MKKILLFGMALTAGFSTVSAEIKTPVIYPSTAIQRVSDDGRIMLSTMYGTVKVIDTVDGTELEYAESEDGMTTYSLGHGNCLTSDGSIFLGSTNTQSDAAYHYAGAWHQLNVPDVEKSNLSNGITPDGSRICGSIGLHNMTFDEVIMQIPAYWDRNDDGTYGEYHVLPYPDKDLFGETPQYVTAISISADGKTIVGQMMFSSGSMAIPVVYTENEEGEWSYDLPTRHLFNPDGAEAVENPGDGPEGPSYYDYMTPENVEAFEAAVNDYFNGTATDYPNFEDYMTEEELAAYNAATQEYQAAYEVWEAKWFAYIEYTDQVLATSPNFVFNNCLLSLDGKNIVSTLQAQDPNSDPWSWFPQTIYSACSVNIETGEIFKPDTELSLFASGVAEGGVILAHNGLGSTPMTAYVISADGEVKSLTDYLDAINPEYGTWISKNLSHEVAVDYDPETWEEIFEELTFTGIPSSTPDLSVIIVYNNCPWDWMEGAESVVFDLNDPSGIALVGASAKDIKILANGIVSVPEGYASLDVYNLNGVNVKKVAEPSGLVKIDVASGAYIIKGQRHDGSVSVIKLAVR